MSVVLTERGAVRILATMSGCAMAMRDHAISGGLLLSLDTCIQTLADLIAGKPDRDDPGMLLAELIEAVQLRHGRQLSVLPDRDGVDRMIALLQGEAPAASEVERASLLDELREAVRIQAPVVHATLMGRASPTTGKRKVIELEPLLIVAAYPRQGEYVTLSSGRRGRVFAPPEHRGAAYLVTLEVVAGDDVEGF